MKILSDKHCQFSVRKLSVGVCSVMIGAFVLGNSYKVSGETISSVGKIDALVTKEKEDQPLNNNSERSVEMDNHSTSNSSNSNANLSEDNTSSLENQANSYRQSIIAWYKEVLKSIQSLNPDEYSQESFEKLSNQLVEANKVISNDSSSDEDLFNISTKVDEVLNALEKNGDNTL